MSDQGDQGERGAQGEAGVAGRQGEAGVAGGEGRPGKTGQEGQRGVPGRKGDRPKLRWAPAVGYLILVVGLAFTLVSIQRLNVDSRARIAAQARVNCEKDNAAKTAEYQQQQDSRKFYEGIADLDERVARTASDRAAGRIVAERAAFWRGLAKNIPAKPPAPADCDFQP